MVVGAYVVLRLQPEGSAIDQTCFALATFTLVGKLLLDPPANRVGDCQPACASDRAPEEWRFTGKGRSQLSRLVIHRSDR